MTNKTTVRKFCGVEIDLKEFEENFPYGKEGKQNHQFYSMFNTKNVKAEFMGFDWYYIGDKDPNSDIFNNNSIKATQIEIEEDSDSIAYDFRTNGYDTSKFPGIVDQHGKFKNGRTRNRSARKCKQDWIPIARFKFTVINPICATISSGSIANSSLVHKTQHKNTMKDYIEQGVSVVESKEYADDNGITSEEVLTQWFLDETNFAKDFDVDSGSLTKVVNIVKKRTSVEYSSINQLSEEQRNKFRDDYKIVDINHTGKIALYKAVGGSAPMKFFKDKILSTGGYPPPTLLYTDSYSPEECGADVNTFITELKSIHKKAVNYVNNKVDSKYVDLIPPIFDTSFIVGVIPNLKNRGNQTELYRSGLAVDWKQYIKDSGYLPSNKRMKKKIDKALGAS